MSDSEEKSKQKGVVATIIFHLLLISSFFFLGLTYQDPPPIEEGISINFGETYDGSENIKPENNNNNVELVKEEIIEKKIQNIKQNITQDIEEVTSVNTSNKTVIKKEEISKEEIIEEKKPEVNKKALYTGKKETKNTSKGIKNKPGNSGNIDGTENSKNYEGGGVGSDDTAYQLSGRSVAFKADPKYDIQVEGKVVVTIIVNRNGEVITAIPGAKGSTTLNKQLLSKAKNAALKTKFSINPNAPENQQGKIIYYFSLN